MQKLKLKNKHQEKLDVWVEGNSKAQTTIIFVHGFATDKHETADYFDDLSKALGKQFKIVRFDLSGCGKSEGKTEDINYQKHAQDLNSVLEFVRNSYFGKVYIFAQSMGCYVTSLLNPDGINKTIFTGLPNSNTRFLAERLKKRFGGRPGAIIDREGISVFPRSTGKLQRIGPSFWQYLSNLNPLKKVEQYSKKTNLLVIYGNQDEILENQYLKEYEGIPGVRVEWINGNHSFTDKKERNNLIKLVQSFFNT